MKRMLILFVLLSLVWAPAQGQKWSGWKGTGGMGNAKDTTVAGNNLGISINRTIYALKGKFRAGADSVIIDPSSTSDLLIKGNGNLAFVMDGGPTVNSSWKLYEAGAFKWEMTFQGSSDGLYFYGADYVLFLERGGGIRIGNSTAPLIKSGAGTPEGVVTAPVSSLFLRNDGGAGTSLYVKESGTGNTGWVGK